MWKPENRVFGIRFAGALWLVGLLACGLGPRALVRFPNLQLLHTFLQSDNLPGAIQSTSKPDSEYPIVEFLHPSSNLIDVLDLSWARSDSSVTFADDCGSSIQLEPRLVNDPNVWQGDL